MRTYGQTPQGKWVEIDQVSYVWMATLVQNLRLIQGESPFYAQAGIPAYKAIRTQIAPTVAVNNIQKQFAQYFTSLTVTPVSGVQVPTYNVQAVLTNGTIYQQVAS
jgi:hypothetical protein